MKTIELTLYKFDELSKEAKENALNQLYDINVDHNWWEFTYEDAKEIGIEINEFDLYRKIIKGIAIWAASDIKKAVLKNHGNTCNTYKTAKFHDLRKSGEGEKMINGLINDYITILNNEYEFLTSEPAIIETIEANNYDFTENGEIYY